MRLLFDKNMKTYRPRRKGERKRKSVRGCIVDSNLTVLNLVIVKKGEQVCFFFSSPIFVEISQFCRSLCVPLCFS